MIYEVWNSLNLIISIRFNSQRIGQIALTSGELLLLIYQTYKKHFSSVLFSTLLATIGGPFDSNEGLQML